MKKEFDGGNRRGELSYYCIEETPTQRYEFLCIVVNISNLVDLLIH